jgi:large subunit ribosomal protein L4
MPEIAVRSIDGGGDGTVTLRDDVFGRAASTALLHQAVVRQQANARQGTHDTRTRGEVSYSTKKWFRQKGTGRARQGARFKPPHHVHGGVAHGPHPRSYRQDLPQRMRAAALCAALSSKAQDGHLVLLSALTMEAASTKTLARILAAVAPGRSALLVLDASNRAVQLSARNLPNVTAITTDNINVVDVLRHEQLVLTTAAARVLEARYSRGEGAGGEGAGSDNARDENAKDERAGGEGAEPELAEAAVAGTPAKGAEE